MYYMIIEMLAGDSMRRHWNKEKQEFIELGLLKDLIPVNDGLAPAHYGFIEGTHVAADGDALDCVLLSDQKFQVGSKVEVRPVAVLLRENGDHKIISVLADDSRGWEEIPKEKQELLVEFLTYKSPLLKIGSEEEAVEMVRECVVE